MRHRCPTPRKRTAAARCGSSWLTLSADVARPPRKGVAAAAPICSPTSSSPRHTPCWHLGGWLSRGVPCSSTASMLWRNHASTASPAVTTSVRTASRASPLCPRTSGQPNSGVGAPLRCLSCTFLPKQTRPLSLPTLTASVLTHNYRALHHSTRLLREETPETPLQAHTAVDKHGDSVTAYDQERHLENAETLLRDVYGPQAKMVLHRLPQRQRAHLNAASAAIAEDDSEAAAMQSTDTADKPALQEVAAPETLISSSPGYYYRVSATFRLLGFPVELAVANGPRAKETIESCLHQALASDITFIRPSGNSGNSGASQGSNTGGSSTVFAKNRRTTGWGGERVAHTDRNGTDTVGDGLQEHRHGRGRGGHPRRQSSWGTTASRPPRLTPHQLELKAILDDLRQLCVHFSRSVKFSIKPPSASFSLAASSSGDGSARAAPANTPEESATAEGSGADGVDASKQWRCRCYVKEEWSTIAQARLALEARGATPNETLVRCITELRQLYREEMDSPAVLEVGVREVAGMVQSAAKTVTASCTAETPSQRAAGKNGSATATSATAAADSDAVPSLLVEVPTYQAQIKVSDVHGNSSTYMARRHASPHLAYQSAATAALRSELQWDAQCHLLSEGLAASPLLWRLRWQFDMLLDHICRETGHTPADVAWVGLSGDADSSNASGDTSAAQVPHGSELNRAQLQHLNRSALTVEATTMGSSNAVPPVPRFFTGSLYSEREVLVWQTTGAGRYRVEFDTYVQALYHLLDQYGDCLSTLPCMAAGVGEGLLFPTASVLELQVHRHDAFPILQYHHGNLNCYALLGTLTSQLLGCTYGTHYHYDSATNEFVATLTVNDGRVSDQPLIQRRSKKKGEAWRFACLDAMRENFPRQYAAILDRHPEVDLSAEDAALRSSHVRSLPREKRMTFFSNLSSMIMTFAEEDLGWRQPRIRLRNLANSIGLPQWMAELEAQVDGEETRRVVATSAAFPQAQAARRSLVFRMAKQYFPKELKMYENLGRKDVIDPEKNTGTSANKLYIPDGALSVPMVRQVVSLMEAKHPTSTPIHYTLEARLGTANTPAGDRLADSEDDHTSSLFDVHSVEGDTLMLLCHDPIALLQPFRVAYKAQVLGNRGEVLIADFDSDSTTTVADAQAVPVLLTALKSASFHLAGGDAETLWTEYETSQLPPATSARELSVALFSVFFGTAAGAGSPEGSGSGSIVMMQPGAESNRSLSTACASDDGSIDFNAAISVISAQVQEYWFSTAILPHFGMLPIARAVSTQKRRSARDALVLAARRSFPRVLSHAAQTDPAAGAVVADILTEPIVEQLPASACRDIMAALARRRKNTPLPPFRLLVKCTKELYPKRERFIRMQQSYDSTHGFQYRLFLQRGKLVRPGDTQLVGYGASSISAPAALHRASIMALENLFESALHAAVAVQHDYREPPLHPFSDQGEPEQASGPPLR